MLQYKKGRFYCEGVSFEIPENFYYDTNIDLMFDNGMEFLSPDKKIIVEFSLRQTNKSTDVDLQNNIDDVESYVMIDPITPITINELHGHQCYYHDSKEHYYLVHLKVSDEYQFIYCLRSIEKDLKEALQEPEFKRTLMEIRKD